MQTVCGCVCVRDRTYETRERPKGKKRGWEGEKEKKTDRTCAAVSVNLALIFFICLSVCICLMNRVLCLAVSCLPGLCTQICIIDFYYLPLGDFFACTASSMLNALIPRKVLIIILRESFDKLSSNFVLFVIPLISVRTVLLIIHIHNLYTFKYNLVLVLYFSICYIHSLWHLIYMYNIHIDSCTDFTIFL